MESRFIITVTRKAGKQKSLGFFLRVEETYWRHAQTIYKELKSKFKKKEGWEVDVTWWSCVGYQIDPRKNWTDQLDHYYEEE